MLITPLAKLEFSDREYKVNGMQATPDCKTIVTYSRDGEVLVMDENLTIIHNYNLEYCIEHFAISPDGKVLAIKNESGHLLVVKIDGTFLFEENTANHQNEVCSDCLFSENGTKLWEIIANTNNQTIIQYRETNNWRVLKQTIVENNLSCCGFFILTSHPASKAISICGLAGQGETWNYWLFEKEAEIEVIHVPQLDDYLLPAFYPEGKEFLAYSDNEGGKISRYSFPDCELMGSAILELEEDWFSFYSCYVSDNRAIGKSEEGRLFLINLDT